MTPADLRRIQASPGWREHRVELFHDTSAGSVIVKGRRAARPAWRYQLLNGFARLSRLPLLQAAPAHVGAGPLHGAAARRTGVRVRAGAQAGGRHGAPPARGAAPAGRQRRTPVRGDPATGRPG
jgi:hypothetical protein